jgi:hypothetical protein
MAENQAQYGNGNKSKDLIGIRNKKVGLRVFLEI